MNPMDTFSPPDTLRHEADDITDNEPLPTFDEPYSMAVHDVSDLPEEIRSAMMRFAIEDGIRQLRNGEGTPFCMREIMDELDAES
jgi:hypothetical protein